MYVWSRAVDFVPFVLQWNRVAIMDIINDCSGKACFNVHIGM